MNSIAAGKGPRAQRRGLKKMEIGYGSLADEYTMRRLISFWKYCKQKKEGKLGENWKIMHDIQPVERRSWDFCV